MNRVLKPLQIHVYQDVLCAWCYVADQRFSVLKREFGELISWSTRPYALRLNDNLPSRRELADWISEIERARQEPEGARITTELWTTEDLPRSSISTLAALEAARLQGGDKRLALARALQRAALEQGVNVTRSDVVFEIAARTGLEMNRFAAAYQSPQTKQLILEEHKLAAARGVKGVPCLVINSRWMLSGLRELSEYREQLVSCIEKASRSSSGGSETVVH